MASTSLVETDKVNGNKSYDVFNDDTGLGLRSVFWWFDESHEDWRLYVVSEYCDVNGPRATYLRLRKHLDKAGLLDDLPLERIVVVGTDNSVAQLVNKGLGQFHRYHPDELRVFSNTEGFASSRTTSSSNVPPPLNTKMPAGSLGLQSSGTSK